LGAITVEATNPAYSSVDGVLFSKGTNVLIQYPGGRMGSYTIPGNATSIGDDAFYFCYNLESVTIPNSVTSIGNLAFYFCAGLSGFYFQGSPPVLGGNFVNCFYATVYYLPGTTGWGSMFGGRPTALWYLPYPMIFNSGPSFGVRTNRFGFLISWATNSSVVVEACTNLSSPVWWPMSTNTLTGTSGTSYFSDSKWTNSRARYYRLRSP